MTTCTQRVKINLGTQGGSTGQLGKRKIASRTPGCRDLWATFRFSAIRGFCLVGDIAAHRICFACGRTAKMRATHVIHCGRASWSPPICSTHPQPPSRRAAHGNDLARAQPRAETGRPLRRGRVHIERRHPTGTRVFPTSRPHKIKQDAVPGETSERSTGSAVGEESSAQTHRSFPSGPKLAGFGSTLVDIEPELVDLGPMLV